MSSKIIAGYLLIVICMVASTAQACTHAITGDITKPNSGDAVGMDVTVDFDSDITCSEGCTISYTWDFGTDAYGETDETTSSPSCKYSSTGSKTIEVTATCSGGGSHTPDTIDITVTDVSVASITTSDTNVCVGTDVTFTVNPSPAGESLDYLEMQKGWKGPAPTDTWTWTDAGSTNPKTDNSSTPGYMKYRARNSTTESWVESPEVTFVDIGTIEIKYGSGATDWDDVTGESINLLNGTKYQFRVNTLPSGITWPSAPDWVWTGTTPSTTSSGATIDLTFGADGNSTLTATALGTVKTVTIDVITPEIDEVEYVDDETIYQSGGTPIPDGVYHRTRPEQIGKSDPACYKKNTKSAVKVKFWHAKKLKYSTAVKINGDVNSASILFTGGDYPETDMTFAASDWSTQSSKIVSETTIQDKVSRKDSTSTRWYYKVPSGTNSDIYTRYSTGNYLIVWGARADGNPCAALTGSETFDKNNYTFAHIQDAIDWGLGVSGTDSKDLLDKVCASVHRAAVYSSPSTTYSISDCWGIHDTSQGDCAHLAFNMAYVARCLGVAANVAFANLAPAINTTQRWSGRGWCSTCIVQGVVVKCGISGIPNAWEGCVYETVASTAGDTLTWCPQMNYDQKEYYKLGNDKSDTARRGLLFDYEWRSESAWGIQHIGHTISVTPLPNYFEYNGN